MCNGRQSFLSVINKHVLSIYLRIARNKNHSPQGCDIQAMASAMLLRCLVRSIQGVGSMVRPPAYTYSTSGYSSARYLCTEKRPRQNGIEFISLIDESGKPLGTRTREAAESLAAKKHMSLCQVEGRNDAKRPIFQLVSHRLKDEDRKKAPNQPEVKMLSLGHKIAINDVGTKVKYMQRWLSKGCEVRVGIVGTPDTSEQQLDPIFKRVEELLKGTDIRILQKRFKNGSIKFTLMSSSSSASKNDTKKVDVNAQPREKLADEV